MIYDSLQEAARKFKCGNGIKCFEDNLQVVYSVITTEQEEEEEEKEEEEGGHYSRCRHEEEEEEE